RALPFVVVSAVGVDCFLFFLQAEDGIRDRIVTGVQSCALPIFGRQHNEVYCGLYSMLKALASRVKLPSDGSIFEPSIDGHLCKEIGRASCRESVDRGGGRIGQKERSVHRRKTNSRAR